MVGAQATPEKDRESIGKCGRNGSVSFEGTELDDELGRIPSFPPLTFDPETGQILPVSDEELAARRDAALRMLKVLDLIANENDTDEKWQEVYRSIDASRPHRPQFKGLY
jgi:hypothetical protein